jgi:hypothetical protein
MSLLVIQHIFLEAFFDIFYAPVWWYSRGIVYWGKKCISWLRSGNETLAPELWLKNLFVPMFGQYDWQGRIISFLMRFVQVIFRSLCLGIWGIMCVIVFLSWIFIPPVVMYEFLSALV